MFVSRARKELILAAGATPHYPLQAPVVLFHLTNTFVFYYNTFFGKVRHGTFKSRTRRQRKYSDHCFLSNAEADRSNGRAIRLALQVRVFATAHGCFGRRQCACPEMYQQAVERDGQVKMKSFRKIKGDVIKRFLGFSGPVCLVHGRPFSTIFSRAFFDIPQLFRDLALWLDPYPAKTPWDFLWQHKQGHQRKLCNPSLKIMHSKRIQQSLSEPGTQLLKISDSRTKQVLTNWGSMI